MNCALIFAGGTGRRMTTSSVPKQFLQLYGKPIIIYTLEKFEANDLVDGIIVVCLKDWIPRMKGYIKKFGITKVKDVVPGGESGQESIQNGLKAAGEYFPEDTIMLIHDGVRPLVAQNTITSAIRCAEEKGNAITVVPATETIFLDSTEGKVGKILDRKQCQMARAPQCFHLADLMALHKRAEAEHRTDFVDSASMARHYDVELYTVEGRSENIKITTPIDFYIFRAIVDANENSQIFGL
jgi:2-C-methyl-D-erythritol 4-phosphate cytidylyltransferase